MLLAAYIIEKEQEKAFAKGLEQGIKQGIKQGIDKAYRDVEEQLDAYFKRMRAAIDEGEPFDEPPPMFRRNGR